MKQEAILFALTMLLGIGCGAPKEVHSKNFRFYLDEPTDTALKSVLQKFFASFNAGVGINRLELVEKPSAANSVMKFKSGIEEETGKIGFGQWRVETSPLSSWRLGSGVVMILHSMSLQFDKEYFANRVEFSSDSKEYRELYLLFCHEVGHGMQLEHSDNPKDLMFPSIDSQRDVQMESFFKKIRNFLDH